jgi:hypothetical protein
MKNKKEKLPQDKDRHLDVPAEANRDKHINFREMEEAGNEDNADAPVDEATKERQRKWKQGIEEGKNIRRQ